MKSFFSSPALTAAYSHVEFSAEQIDCICDSLSQRGDLKTLENFLSVYSSKTSGQGSNNSSSSASSSNTNEINADATKLSEAVMRAKAYAAYESGNYR